jgi:hypothetical protein
VLGLVADDQHRVAWILDVVIGLTNHQGRPIIREAGQGRL